MMRAIVERAIVLLTVGLACVATVASAEPARTAVTIWSDGTRLAGDLWIPEGLDADQRVPGILLVHGWGGQKSHLNAAYAPHFASRGFIVLTFDYRGWGESDGKFVRHGPKPEPSDDGLLQLRVREIREVVDPLDQLEDIRNALAYLMGESQVMTDTLGIWGSSLGGGLALQTAARFPEIKVLVSQVGAVNNLANWPERARKDAWATQIKRVRGDLPPFPGEAVALDGLDGVPDYDSLMRYDPFSAAPRLDAATLIIDATGEAMFDTSKNGKALYDAIRGRVPAKYMTIEGGHYDVYRGDGYRKALAAEIEWFVEHLK